MMTGLLRPDAGKVSINGADVWRDPAAVKAAIGVLPEGLRLFDRLSGPELLVVGPCYGLMLAWAGLIVAANVGFRRLPEVLARVSSRI